MAHGIVSLPLSPAQTKALLRTSLPSSSVAMALILYCPPASGVQVKTALPSAPVVALSLSTGVSLTSLAQ